MDATKRGRLILYIFMSLFLLGGILHVAAYGVDGLNSITSIYYCFILMLWSISVQRRIVDRKIKMLLLKCAGIMTLTYLLQTCRFLLWSDLLTVNRYLIYVDYVSGLIQASLFLEIGLRLIRKKDNDASYRLIFLPAFILSIMIMTNDLHQVVIYFPDGLEYAKTSYSYRFGIWIFSGWMVAAYIGYIFMVLKSCRVSSIKKMIWLPLSFPLIGGVLLLLHIFDVPKINGHIVWQNEDMMFLIFVGLAEACIEMGLIPSNMDYNRLFKLAKNKAVITDMEGKVVFSSSDENELPVQGEDAVINSEPIHGGRIVWSVDISTINRLNRQLLEAAEEIDLRNEYLRHQNELQEEKSQLEARITLYDRISSIVHPQLEAVNSLMKRFEKISDKAVTDNGISDAAARSILAHIAVLNAYVKRRSNMELLREVSDTLTMKELFTALAESCEYIKLCGVTAVVSPASDGIFGASRIIAAYDFFETVAENNIGKMKSLMVTVSDTGEELVLRILTDSSVIPDKKLLAPLEARFSEIGARYSFEKEEDGYICFLAVPKGGDAV